MSIICRKCGIEKDENEFYRTRKQCKECNKVQHKILYEKNREKYLAYGKEYRDTHKEKFNAYYKEYHKEHRNEHLTYNRKHYLNEDRKYIRWAAASLGAHRSSGYKTIITTKQLANIIENIKFCPICGIEFNFAAGNGYNMNNPSLDRLNNENEIREDNIQIICRRCNTHKSDKTLIEMDQWVLQWQEYRKKMTL